MKKIWFIEPSSDILVLAVRKGWGLVVTKANAMGTPATGHHVSGLGDSLRYGENGISIIDKSPAMMAQQGFTLPRSKASFQL